MRKNHALPPMNPSMFPRATSTLLLGAIIALSPGLLAAQPSPENSRPPPDAEIIARPPASVDSKLAKPVPPGRDPGLVERPPANDLPGERNQPIGAPSSPLSSPLSPPPPRNDCKGAASAEACGQNPAR